MIRIIYHEHAKAIRDDEAEKMYADLRTLNDSGIDTTRFCSSANLFNRIRCGMAEDELKPADVVFVVNGEELHPNEYGAIPNWPRGWLEYDIELCERILTAAMRRHKENRSAKETRLMLDAGWYAYPKVSESGEFIEDLDIIQSLLGSILYEVRTKNSGTYIRRIA